MLENNVIEYGPGDIQYLSKSGYKLNPQSPIVEIWIENCNKLENRENFSDNFLNFYQKHFIPILGGIVAVNFAMGQTTQNTVVLGAEICFFGAVLVSQMKKIYKKNKYKDAIFYYEKLKEYEEQNPNKPKITNNPTLKGVSAFELNRRTTPKQKKL